MVFGQGSRIAYSARSLPVSERIVFPTEHHGPCTVRSPRDNGRVFRNNGKGSDEPAIRTGKPDRIFGTESAGLGADCVSQSNRKEGEIVKDIVYYFILWVLPFGLGFLVASPFNGIGIQYPLLLLLTMSLGYLRSPFWIMHDLPVIYDLFDQNGAVCSPLNLPKYKYMLSAGNSYLFTPAHYLL